MVNAGRIKGGENISQRDHWEGKHNYLEAHNGGMCSREQKESCRIWKGKLMWSFLPDIPRLLQGLTGSRMIPDFEAGRLGELSWHRKDGKRVAWDTRVFSGVMNVKSASEAAAGEGRGPAAKLRGAPHSEGRGRKSWAAKATQRANREDGKRQTAKDLEAECVGLKIFTSSGVFEIKDSIGHIQFSMFGWIISLIIGLFKWKFLKLRHVPQKEGLDVVPQLR